MIEILIGLLAWGVFVVLLSAMILVLANPFQRIEDEIDQENSRTYWPKNLQP